MVDHGRRHVSWRHRARYGGLAMALPANASLAILLGLSYLFAGADRFATPAFAAAREIMPIWAWGAVFLVGGLAQAAVYLHGRKGPILVALWAAVSVYMFWACLFGISGLLDPRANPNGAILYLFVAITHATTALSVTRGPG